MGARVANTVLNVPSNFQDCCKGGRPCGGRAISDSLGLQLTNKQIHAEVSKILFSQNHFGILMDTDELRRTF